MSNQTNTMQTYLIKLPRQSLSRPAATCEQLFSELHETLAKNTFSLEIIAMGQNLAFCFAALPADADVIASAIYSIVSDADIVSIGDPIKKLVSSSYSVVTNLGLRYSYLLPLKEYQSFEGSSLTSLLSVLSKCTQDEVVAIQYVMSSKRDSAFLQLSLATRKRWEKLLHFFRIKYWFKQGASNSLWEAIASKSSQRLFTCSIRVAVSSNNTETSTLKLRAIIGALSSFNTIDQNRLTFTKPKHSLELRRQLFQRKIQKKLLLSISELATMWHLPNAQEVPNLVHVLSRKGSPPTTLPCDNTDGSISFFGSTNFRNMKIPFGTRNIDRRRHHYVVGKSGSGKSKLLELLIKNDIDKGYGVGVLDPHGDLVDNILRHIPQHRLKDVVIFDPSDMDFPASFNPLEQVPEALKMRVTIGFLEIFKKLFGSNWSPRLEHVLRYTTLALLDTPGTTILSILKMLTDKNYRQFIVRNIKDDVVRNFWVNEFASWSEKFDSEAITPLLNKVGQFVSTNMIRNIVGQPDNRFDFREFIDNNKIVLMKVSKGILGEENAALLGAIAVTKIYQAAMSRADIREDKRVDFYFYVDEFHNFATDTFDEILSEARKYRLNLTIANQFLGQLPDSIRKTVFGNVGTITSFRLGGEDAQVMADEFQPRFTESDILNLGVRDFYTKMSIDGEVQDAFSGKTLTVKYPDKDYSEACIAHSRSNFAKPLSEVKEILQNWEEGNTKIIEKTSHETSNFQEPLL